MIVHLVDGTHELFRHIYGLRRFTKGKDRPYGAVVGVLQTVLQMIDSVKGSASRGQGVEGFDLSGQNHAYIGVATDHVIESFRNRLWADYKTGAGIERALLAQFHPLDEALAAMGVVVWPMTEFEADDALASAARLASEDGKVQKVAIWTPNKDLARCVSPFTAARLGEEDEGAGYSGRGDVTGRLGAGNEIDHRSGTTDWKVPDTPCFAIVGAGLV